MSDQVLYVSCGNSLTAVQLDPSTSQVIPVSSPCAVPIPEVVPWLDTFQIVTTTWFTLLFIFLTVQTVRKALVVMKEKDDQKFWRNVGWQLYFRLDLGVFFFVLLVSDPVNAYGIYSLESYFFIIFAHTWLILSQKYSIAASSQRSFFAVKGYPEHYIVKIEYLMQLFVLGTSIFISIPPKTWDLARAQKIVTGVLCSSGAILNLFFGTWMYIEYQKTSAGLASKSQNQVGSIVRRLLTYAILTFFLSTTIAIGCFLTAANLGKYEFYGVPVYTKNEIGGQILLFPGLLYLGGTVYTAAFASTWKLNPQVSRETKVSAVINSPKHETKSSAV